MGVASVGVAYITGGVEKAPPSLLEESFYIVIDCFHDLSPVQTLNTLGVLLVT